MPFLEIPKEMRRQDKPPAAHQTTRYCLISKATANRCWSLRIECGRMLLAAKTITANASRDEAPNHRIPSSQHPGCFHSESLQIGNIFGAGYTLGHEIFDGFPGPNPSRSKYVFFGFKSSSQERSPKNFFLGEKLFSFNWKLEKL